MNLFPSLRKEIFYEKIYVKRMFCTMTVLITAPYHDEGLKELTELFGRTVHSTVEEARPGLSGR